MAMRWDAIADIPDRVNEIAALVDPNALRYVGWNDISNELELLAFDAADIPYDNTTSGLTATEVQAAIDEIAGVTAPTTYWGWVNTAGDQTTVPISRLPAGWTVNRSSTGVYTVTHGLGLADVRDLAIVVTVFTNDASSYEWKIRSTSANSFTVNIWIAGMANGSWFFNAADTPPP